MMKSVIIEAPGKVKMIEVAEPVINSDEVLLEIQYIGLCGSDLSSYRGLSPLVNYPVVPGHEVSGIVISKGDNVPDFIHIGDPVTVNPYSACGRCPACRAGRVNTCEFNQTLGVQRNGALSEYFAVNYSKIIKSDLLISKEFALVEPLSVGYHAANRGDISETDSVLIIGCGMIGIGAILASVKKGAMVIAADLDETKLKLIESLGVKHTINARKTDILTRIREITNGEGVSVCIEAVGSPITYTAAIEAVAFAGRVIYVGYAKNDVSFNTSLFVKKELNICGSRNALFEFGPVIQMLEDRTIPTGKLISKIYPIDETAMAFKDWSDKPADFIKILIDVRNKSGLD
jgi:2-desacetyl-2-hydroxyethyl bacteriochlorophyllide A dehydrogenase